jgi:hypothetical protein
MLIPTMNDAPEDAIASVMVGDRTGICADGTSLLAERAG